MYVPRVTHEIVLHALDPDGRRQPLINGEANFSGSIKFLKPVNFAAQFTEASDGAADLRVRDAVRRVCEGALSPDTDYIYQWVELFGGNMLAGGPVI